MKYKNIQGKKFGKLTAVSYYGNDKYGNALWFCKCECGNIKICLGSQLRTGHTKSCGCWQRETAKKGKLIHGYSRTALYKRWFAIKSRCENTKNPSYKNYGGRGITMCNEWRDFLVFQEWALNNGYEQSLTIERVDVNENYEPNNCIFANRTVQNRNTTRTYNVNGYTASQISEMVGLSRSTIAKWLRCGMVKTYEEICIKAKIVNEKKKIYNLKEKKEN